MGIFSLVNESGYDNVGGAAEICAKIGRTSPMDQIRLADLAGVLPEHHASNPGRRVRSAGEDPALAAAGRRRAALGNQRWTWKLLREGSRFTRATIVPTTQKSKRPTKSYKC
jgi:hypothetical protein